MERKIYLLWFGQTISWTGSSMSFFAIGVWIYETTGKASALSTILFIVAIVGVVTGPFGGVLADRFQRKKLIIIFDLTIAVLMCIIGYLALNNILTLTPNFDGNNIDWKNIHQLLFYIHRKFHNHQ